jgi:hypothetical protein
MVCGSLLVTHNRMSGLVGPGVILIEGTTQSAVEQNDISNGRYQSSWAAGIVVSDRDADLTGDPRAIYDPGGYWPILSPVKSRLNPPHDNFIAFNHVALNVSSGIYMDGGIRNVVFSNHIRRHHIRSGPIVQTQPLFRVAQNRIRSKTETGGARRTLFYSLTL